MGSLMACGELFSLSGSWVCPEGLHGFSHGLKRVVLFEWWSGCVLWVCMGSLMVWRELLSLSGGLGVSRVFRGSLMA